MLKVLAINYSQSGQLNEIVDNFLFPIKEDTNFDIDRIVFDLEKPFPFPWTNDAFFDTMPESVNETAQSLEKINYKHENYDIVILGYQPWFLSPSVPTSSLLQSSDFKKRIKSSKVISLIGARNMWLNSQESIKKYLKQADATLIGNVPLVDKTHNFTSAITILYWMLTGKKEKFLGIFPKPGVAEDEIKDMTKFGDIFLTANKNKEINKLQEKFLATGKIKILTSVMFVELRGKELFKIWAKLIQSKPNSRKLIITLYKYYLLFAFFIVAPILLTILNIFVFPFTKSYFQKKKSYFCGLE